jgi:hypothetical protein
MQSDPSKQGYNNYGNTSGDQYPPTETGNIYPYEISLTQNFPIFKR